MTAYQRSARALWRTVPGHLLLCGCDGNVVDVTGSGALVWELLATPRPADDLVAEVARRCNEAPGVVHAPVLDLLDQLAARQLVEAR